MRIDILTVFPDMFTGPLTDSILKRAQEKGLLQVVLHDIRTFTSDRHRTTDDTPYGGGPGMVMKAEPIAAALSAVEQDDPAASDAPVIMMSPAGRRFDQSVARELAERDRLVLLCGHYEGIDERVRAALVTDEISIGDFVLTGGELPAMVIVDAVARLLPGVLGDDASSVEESFGDGLLEYPQYTRPPVFAGLSVPEVLLSGDHGEIRKWRRKEALRATLLRRPDLLAAASLDSSDRQLLDEIVEEQNDQPEPVFK